MTCGPRAQSSPSFPAGGRCRPRRGSRFGRGYGLSDRAGELLDVEGVARDAGRGFGQAIGLNQRPSGEFAPFLRNRPLHRHASGKGKPEAGEVEPG